MPPPLIKKYTTFDQIEGYIKHKIFSVVYIYLKISTISLLLREHLPPDVSLDLLDKQSRDFEILKYVVVHLSADAYHFFPDKSLLSILVLEK